ncbi:MAG: TRAP transporter small permease [Burkholderiaceae bacterium]
MNKDQEAGGTHHWIWDLPSWLAAAALFALMVMTFSDVVLRSTIDNPIEAATEMTRIFMAIIVFSCLPAVSWRGTHIVVDLLDSKFTASIGRARDVAIDLLCGAMLVWPAWRVFELAARAHSYGDVTEYLNIPQFYMAGFVGISVALTSAVLLLRGIAQIVRPELLPHRVSS